VISSDLIYIFRKIIPKNVTWRYKNGGRKSSYRVCSIKQQQKNGNEHSALRNAAENILLKLTSEQMLW
jgi:hypothetical protein